jgi:hypothetical protein
VRRFAFEKGKDRRWPSVDHRGARPQGDLSMVVERVTRFTEDRFHEIAERVKHSVDPAVPKEVQEREAKKLDQELGAGTHQLFLDAMQKSDADVTKLREQLVSTPGAHSVAPTGVKIESASIKSSFGASLRAQTSHEVEATSAVRDLQKLANDSKAPHATREEAARRAAVLQQKIDGGRLEPAALTREAEAARAFLGATHRPAVAFNNISFQGTPNAPQLTTTAALGSGGVQKYRISVVAQPVPEAIFGGAPPFAADVKMCVNGMIAYAEVPVPALTPAEVESLIATLQDSEAGDTRDSLLARLTAMRDYPPRPSPALVAFVDKGMSSPAPPVRNHLEWGMTPSQGVLISKGADGSTRWAFVKDAKVQVADQAKDGTLKVRTCPGTFTEE